MKIAPIGQFVLLISQELLQTPFAVHAWIVKRYEVSIHIPFGATEPVLPIDHNSSKAGAIPAGRKHHVILLAKPKLDIFKHVKTPLSTNHSKKQAST
jgi:hypothetical protein